MKALRIIAGLMSLFIVLPIWFFLFYRVLQAVDASELMWFLYWVYVPAAMCVHAIVRAAGDE